MNSGALFPILLSSYQGRKTDCCTAFPSSGSTPIEAFCRKFSAFLYFLNASYSPRTTSLFWPINNSPYLALFVLHLFPILARCKTSHLCSRRKCQEPQLVDTSEEANVGNTCYDWFPDYGRCGPLLCFLRATHRDSRSEYSPRSLFSQGSIWSFVTEAKLHTHTRSDHHSLFEWLVVCGWEQTVLNDRLSGLN